MFTRVSVRAGLFAFFMANFATTVPAEPADFNKFVIRSVNEVVRHRSGGGYDIRSVFTKTLDYDGRPIKASNPPKTMCVAGVTEVIIEAINLYSKDTGDKSVYETIPVTSWSKGNLTSLRANIFMYAGTGSRGTGHTLERFGIGKQIAFSEAKAGDFINFNRTSGTGHAVVFLGYIDAAGKILNEYSTKVVGFRYFSAQGMAALTVVSV